MFLVQPNNLISSTTFETTGTTVLSLPFSSPAAIFADCGDSRICGLRYNHPWAHSKWQLTVVIKKNYDFLYTKVCTPTLIIKNTEPPNIILYYISILMLTPQLTISSWALEKLLVAQWVHKFNSFAEFRRLIIGSTYILHWCISWATWIQYTNYYPNFKIRFSIILPFRHRTFEMCLSLRFHEQNYACICHPSKRTNSSAH